MRAERARQMRLRIEVDTQRPQLSLRNTGEQVDARRRLADTIGLIEHRDDAHGGR